MGFLVKGISIILLIILIIIIITVIVTVNKSNSNSKWPPDGGTPCPDYWTQFYYEGNQVVDYHNNQWLCLNNFNLGNDGINQASGTELSDLGITLNNSYSGKAILSNDENLSTNAQKKDWSITNALSWEGITY